MSRPNFELLRDAFAIIDGIPDQAFRLDAWVKRRGDALDCGTIACAGGWLAQHPKFTRMGLTLNFSGDFARPELHNRARDYQALSQMFSLRRGDEVDIFAPRHTGYKDDELSLSQHYALSDQKLWKRRVLRLFQEYGESFDPKVAEGLHLDARGAK
ncbi:hypothetical protein ACODYM_28815 [Burkholderia gladioli]|uniref:hypothetical protein n=1 Tax=Burkholderia gladioli TaxID=28095 RepID=UPI003B514949